MGQDWIGLCWTAVVCKVSVGFSSFWIDLQGDWRVLVGVTDVVSFAYLFFEVSSRQYWASKANLVFVGGS